MSGRPRPNVRKYPEGFNLRKRFTKKKYPKKKNSKKKNLKKSYYGFADRKKQPEKEILGDRREKFHQLYVAVFDQ